MQSPMQQPPGQQLPPPGTPTLGQPPPPYPSPPAGYASPYPPSYAPYLGYLPPVKPRVPRWRQALILLLTPCVALVVGFPVLALGLWGTYGDSPTPPLHADRAAGWLVAAYLSIGILFGLGVHAIVIRKPWLFLAGLVVTLGVIGGMIWAYINLVDNLQIDPGAFR